MNPDKKNPGGDITTAAVIVAAGSGIRMGTATRKQYLRLGDESILAHTLRVFDTCPKIDQIVLVVPKTDMVSCKRELPPVLNPAGPLTLTAGGKTRQDSVYLGLKQIRTADTVVIHDAVRPFVTHDMITACLDGMKETGAAISAIPASDTLKRVSNDGFIEQTLTRDSIWLAQTPQAFALNIIKKAHARAKKDGIRGTDDASLVERLGVPVRVVPGSPLNIKITTSEDLKLARAIFSMM